MKKINILIFLIFLFLNFVSYGQTTTLIPAGKWYVKNFATTDEIIKASRNIKMEAKGVIPYADTVFYVPSTAPDDTITTLMNNRPSKKNALIVLQRGSSRNTTITVSKDSILFSSYGTGVKPKIYGSVPLVGWTKRSNTNIYVKYYPTADINQIFVDGVRMQEARYPTTGFANVDVAPTTSSLTCNALNGALNYTGVTCLIHSSSYGLDKRSVSSSSSTTLTLNSAPFGDVSLNEKFILVGKLEFLTVAGQWYYNTSNDTCYLWTPAGTDPDNFNIRGSVTDYGITATNKNYLTVKNIEFAHQKINGIQLTNCDYATIDNVTINDPDDTGIRMITGGDFAKIKNNTIKGANHFGIETYTASSKIYDNVIDSTALFDNLGSTGIGSWYMGSAIYVEGNSNAIRHNRADEIGYNGVHYSGIDTVEYNYITNFCRTKNDGGGVYTSAAVNYQNETNKGSIIRYNTVKYGYGISTNGSPYSEGIYLDESSGGITSEYNYIEAMTGRGIFSHKGNGHTIRYNTLFNNYEGIYLRLDGRNLTVTNNLVYGKTDQRLQHDNGMTVSPTINSNNYINHYTSNPFRVDDATSYTFANWQSTTGYDASSTMNSTTLTTNYTDKMIVNTEKVLKKYYLNHATNVLNEATSASITADFYLSAHTGIIVTGLNVDCILDYSDIIAPVITSFTIAETSSNLTITPTTLTSTGGTTLYKLTESGTAPSLESSGWSISPSYTFSTAGAKTLYVWARDAAGNISTSLSDNITVSINLKNNLVASYEFEANGTTLVDAHTNNLSGSNKDSGGADLSVTRVTGLPGDAYSYISTGLKYSTIPNNTALEFSNTWTASLWVNVTSLASARGLINKRGATTNSEFSSWINTNGSIALIIAENGDYTNRVTLTTSAGDITTATNYLIEFKSDGTDRKAGFKIYVNGVEKSVTYSYAGSVSSDLTVGIVHGTSPLLIGSDLTAGANMYGNISQVSIWNKVLAPAESSALYNSGSGLSYTSW